MAEGNPRAGGRRRRRRHHRHCRADRRHREPSRSARCASPSLTPQRTAVRTFRFPGNRELVKTFAAFTALDMVRRVSGRRRRRTPTGSGAWTRAVVHGLFVAADIDERHATAVRRRLRRRLQVSRSSRARVRRGSPGSRPDATAHVTLRFIGEDIERTTAATAGSRRWRHVCASIRSTVTWARLGTFPVSLTPACRSGWALSTAGAGLFTQLAQVIDRAARSASSVPGRIASLRAAPDPRSREETRARRRLAACAAGCAVHPQRSRASITSRSTRAASRQRPTYTAVSSSDG